MEPVEGFNQQRDSLMEGIQPILDEYTLTSLKIQQLQRKGFPVPYDLQMILNKCVHELSGILFMPPDYLIK